MTRRCYTIDIATKDFVLEKKLRENPEMYKTKEKKVGGFLLLF